MALRPIGTPIKTLGTYVGRTFWNNHFFLFKGSPGSWEIGTYTKSQNRNFTHYVKTCSVLHFQISPSGILKKIVNVANDRKELVTLREHPQIESLMQKCQFYLVVYGFQEIIFQVSEI